MGPRRHRQVPAARQGAPQPPWRLTLLVERALKTDPSRRPSAAAELASLLARLPDEHGGPSDPALRLTGWLVAIGNVPEETLTAMLPPTTTLYVVHEEIPLQRRAMPWRMATLSSMLLATRLLAVVVFATDLVDRATRFFTG